MFFMDKYIMLSLDDEKSKNIADVIANPTCKKILNLLSEKEASETDIANELGVPLNTIDYNIKKLKKAGMIETKNFFWSVKGKKIPIYKLAKKHIIISPKKTTLSKLKPILPVAIISGIIALIIKIYFDLQIKTRNIMQEIVPKTFDETAEAVASSATGTAETVTEKTPVIISITTPYWPWFLLGALTAILIFLIWTWKKSRKF